MKQSRFIWMVESETEINVQSSGPDSGLEHGQIESL